MFIKNLSKKLCFKDYRIDIRVKRDSILNVIMFFILAFLVKEPQVK